MKKAAEIVGEMFAGWIIVSIVLELLRLYGHWLFNTLEGWGTIAIITVLSVAFAAVWQRRK